MKPNDFEKHILDTYGVSAEHPWPEYPHHAVFRHQNNRKWFAVMMRLPAEKIGLPSGGEVDVVNLKCDPLLLGSLLLENGIHRAYHMNKNHWITVRLDGSLPMEKIGWLLDLSFDLTNKKR